MTDKQSGKANILYVDDEQLNLTLFKASFEKEYNVFLAESGKEALEILEKEQFAVIISDQRMPGMLGTELLEITREKHPGIIRFMLTAYTDYQTVVDSINMGKIYGFFNKPFKYEEVKIALDKAIEVYKLREGNARMVEEVEQANQQLRTIDKVRTRFLTSITNEIKSPITRIMSVVNVLKDNVASTDLAELVNYLDGSLAKLERFSFVTNQLARLTDDEVNLTLTDISLKELMETAIIESLSNPAYSGKKIGSGELLEKVTVKGEFELLLTCLTILLEVSLEQLPENEKIILSSCKLDDKIALQIQIPGGNFNEDELRKLRNFFSSTGKSYDYHMGLEIILARQIMTAHKGDIGFSKEGNEKIFFEMLFPGKNNT